VDIKRLHSWDLNYLEARDIQTQLARKLSFEFPGCEIKTVAGADISYSRLTRELYAGVVLLKLSDFAVIERVWFGSEVAFPYIPGLLSFREAPSLLEAFRKLTKTPDVALFDGHGIAHPRGLGLASHIGLLLDIPTIGCAKENLVGQYDFVGEDVGDFSEIKFNSQAVGAALRTRKNVKPIFVSPGHKMNLEKSLEIVLKFLNGFRIPEPVRLAHIYVNQIRSARSN
jgi:deoxyribonuclease V